MGRKVEEERRVLPFSRPVGRIRSRVLDRDGARGEILLFTGVRYERLSDEDLTRMLAGLPRPGETDLRLGG